MRQSEADDTGGAGTIGDCRRPRDLLLQAVEGMERPLFVLDDGLAVPLHQPGRCARARPHGRDARRPRASGTEFPEAVGGPFEELYRRVRANGRSGSTEAWFAPLGKWFRADAFLTDAGLVVTYDDVTERRRTEDGARGGRRRARGGRRGGRPAAAEAKTAGRHLMLLGDINLAMTSTLDTDEAVDRFAHLVVPLLADWCLVSVIDPDGTRRDVGRAHSDPAMVEAMHRYADAAGGHQPVDRAGADRAAAAASRVIIPEFTAGARRRDGGRPEAAARRWSRCDAAAVAAFPLIARGEVFGALTLVNGPERGARTPTDELRTAEIASRRAALALDNARLAAANQQVAERLQLSLLSPPVQPDQLELAVRYRPATQGVSIGGDWYDAFLQPDGDTVLVIGDVMGHDIEAAAAMGQVKTLVRGIAFDRLEEPAGVLRRVDHALVGPGRAGAWRPRWSAAWSRTPAEHAAGTAPAALGLGRAPGADAARSPTAPVVDLTAPVGPPLGIGWLGAAGRRRGDDARGQHAAAVHRRAVRAPRGPAGRGPRAGPRDPRRARPDLPLDALCDRLLAELLGEGVEDDVAVLAVRAHPVDADRPAEAGPEILPPAVRSRS